MLDNSLSTLPLLIGMTPRIWYGIPLIVVVGLVYGATRHENLKEIFVHAFRAATLGVGLMTISILLIWVSGFWN